MKPPAPRRPGPRRPRARSSSAWRLLAPAIRPRRRPLSGYIEGETLYLSAAERRAGSRASPCAAASACAAGTRLFLIEPDQQVAPGPSRRAAELAAARAQAEDARHGPAPAGDRDLRGRPRRRRGARRARRGSRSTAPTRWSGAASTPGSGSTRRAPPIRRAAARVEAARRRIDAATLGQREDQIRAADARVAQAQARVSETGARLGTLSPDRALGRRGSRRSSSSAANGRRPTSRSSP